MNLFNRTNDDITNGIESTIWKSIEKSIENDNIETFNVLNKFVINVLYLGIKNNSIEHFRKYIIFPASYYYKTLQKVKENIKFQKSHKHCTEIAASQLKEIIGFYLRYDENDILEKKYNKLKENNLFLYEGFNGFSRLLYQIISNSDLSKFDYVINEYYLIDQLGYNSYNDLKHEIRYNFKNESSEEIGLKRQLYDCVKYFDIYKRHVLIGLRYWTIFLYMVEKNNTETTVKFLEELKIFSDTQELLKDIIFLRNHPNYNYFEWGTWDYKERRNGVSYYPPSSRNWLTFGFLIDLIRIENPYLSSEFLSSKELSEINFFNNTIAENIIIIKNNFAFYQPILNLKSEEELEKRTSLILNSFNNLKRESFNITYREIAEKELNVQKINDFKELIGETWNKFSLIRKLFVNNNNVEIVNTDINFIGQKTFFERGKRMFIEGDNYQQIYNVGDIGGQTSRWIDDEFFNKIILESKHLKEGVNIIDTINNCINFLEKTEVIPTNIIVPSDYSYKDDLLYHKDFISKHDIEDKIENELSKYFIGKYKGLDVYISHSDYILNKIVISDFGNSFKMKYKVSPDWYNNELKIEVNSISDDDAELKYNINPKKWVIRDDGTYLTKEEALLLIKNAVNLEIGAYIEFEIKESQPYVVGLIQNKVEK